MRAELEYRTTAKASRLRIRIDAQLLKMKVASTAQSDGHNATALTASDRAKPMIALQEDELVFSFPHVHPQANLRVAFQRTLRIPDDGKSYPLPPGLGAFPLRHVDDFSQAVPAAWLEHGGVVLPMYQSEALWIHLQADRVYERRSLFSTPGYPFAIKVATGKVNAITGQHWTNDLRRNPQDYVVTPGQPWLDGYCVRKGLVRQFVAMPLGSGYGAEEQTSGHGECGGLQIMVCPMKRQAFERRFPIWEGVVPQFCMADAEMGLAPGGLMRQEVFEDPYDLNDWEVDQSSRCFVHIANSLVWRSLTGKNPPAPPPTAKEYTEAGLPWFEYYSDNLKPLAGPSVLGLLKSVSAMGRKKGDIPLPENESIDPSVVKKFCAVLQAGQVREGTF